MLASNSTFKNPKNSVFLEISLNTLSQLNFVSISFQKPAQLREKKITPLNSAFEFSTSI